MLLPPVCYSKNNSSVATLTICIREISVRILLRIPITWFPNALTGAIVPVSSLSETAEALDQTPAMFLAT